MLSFATIHIMPLFDISKWVGVSVGLSLFVTTLMLEILNACAFKNRKGIHVTALAVNAIADGLAASSLFVHLGEFPQLWQTVVIFVVMLVAFALYILLTNITFAKDHFVSSIIIYVAIVFIAGLSCLLSFPNALAACALALLFLTVFIAFLVSLPISARHTSEHIKHITYCSFVALAAVIVIVLIVLSEGDVLSGIGDTGDSPKKDRKRNPYNYIAVTHSATNSLIHVNSKKRRKNRSTPPENQEPNDTDEQ